MGNPLKILHLEDDALAAELVLALLESEGIVCETVRVDTRSDFVSALEGCRFDLILADYSLPSFDGLSALTIAREMCPEVPYIFISGQMGEDIAVESLKSGATDYVLKDRLSRLTPAIHRALRDAKDRIERKKAEENVKKINRIYAVLDSVNHLIIRVGDQQALFEGACRLLVEEGLFRMAWVGLSEEATRTVKPVFYSGCEEGYLKDINISIDDVPTGEGPTGVAVRTARHSINNDTENNPAVQLWRADALKRGYLSSAAFPLTSEGRAFGAITVYAAERNFFDDEEVRLLDALAADISYAVRSMEQEGLRIQAEAESRELGEKLQSLVEDALVGVYIMQDNLFVYVNDRMAEMLGYSKEEILAGLDVFNIIHPDDRAMVRENIRRRIDGEVKTINYEFRMIRKDGSSVFMEVLSSYALYQGKPSIIGTILDITDRKELERQKADFYAMITHDFKSPLTTILSYTEFIITDKSDGISPALLDMISTVYNAGVNLLEMADDFLSLSKMESGKLSLNLALAEVSDVLTIASSSLERVSDSKKLTFVKDIPADMPAAMLDQKLVKRALENLLGNAINYTPAGGQITLKADKISDCIVIAVSDTGHGIPKEEQERVFDKYYRSSRTAGVKGTGLGLAIVKAVAEGHGGHVELESEEGKGSTFRMFLPILPARKTPVAQ